MLIKKNTAFTLVELMVTISIIGILSAITMISFSSSKAKARDTERVGEIQAIATALELYYSKYKYYPNLVSVLVPNYLPSEPKDPSTGQGYKYVSFKADNLSSCSFYHLGAKLESFTEGKGPLADDADLNDSSSTYSSYVVCSGSGTRFDGTSANADEIYDLKSY